MAKSSKPRKKRQEPSIPLGMTPVDIDTFIAGIDASMANGEFDDDLEEMERELVPSEPEEKREDTVFDVMLAVFYDAARAWNEKSIKTDNPSNFKLIIQPQPYTEGEYAVIISMKLLFQNAIGGLLVCEKKYGCVALNDLQKDDWKIALLREMITELFGMTSLFIQAKQSINTSDILKYQVRKGDNKRKGKE
jgi:hypothetical protein